MGHKQRKLLKITKVFESAKICIMQEGFKFAFYSEPKEKCLVRIKTLMEASSLTEVLKTFKKVFS